MRTEGGGPRVRRGQLDFHFRTWGGRRPGAGRKPKGKHAGLPHIARPPVASRHPVLVTLRVGRDVPALRNRRAYGRLERCLFAARERHGARIVHFSVQDNHMHLIVEAHDRVALSRAMRGLAVRLARAVNAEARRRGNVFPERYHARVLKTPLEVYRAIRYVLLNARRHAAKRKGPFPAGWMDACSSARWFDGWTLPDAVERAIGLPRFAGG